MTDLLADEEYRFHEDLYAKKRPFLLKE